MFSCEYCKNFKNSFFYRATVVAVSGIDRFFYFEIHNFKIYGNSMTQHNLMISFSVSSGQPGKYSYEIPHEYL